MTPLREILEGIIARECPVPRVALLLSGGVDSLSLGFAATALGKQVVAYTFQVGEWESSDSIAAKRRSLEGVLVPVTASMNEEMLRSAGFVSVECVWRWMNFAGWIAVK